MASTVRKISSALLIDTSARFLLQQRDNIVGIAEPGKVGLFGGHREGRETGLQCAVREIQEEIGLGIPADRFELLCRYDGFDLEIAGSWIEAEFYVVKGVPPEDLNITEGSLVIVEADRIKSLHGKLAPWAAFVLNVFRNADRAPPAGRLA